MAIEETDALALLDSVQQPRAMRQRGLSSASSKPQSQSELSTTAPNVADEEEEEEGDDLGDDSGSAYEESIQVTAVIPEVSSKPKRGRKPAPAQSRAARDLARKSNHSRIEKRRREKINDALATLREIVPPAAIDTTPGDAPTPVVEDDTPTSGKGKKKAGSEREFKLEVLERSVIFIRQLSERVRELEDELTRTQLPKSSDSGPDRKIGEDLSPRKRRRDSLSPSTEDRLPRQRLSPFPDPSNRIQAMPLPASPPDSTLSPYFARRTSDSPAKPANTLSNADAGRRMSLPSISEMLGTHQLLSPSYSNDAYVGITSDFNERNFQGGKCGTPAEQGCFAPGLALPSPVSSEPARTSPIAPFTPSFANRSSGGHRASNHSAPFPLELPMPMGLHYGSPDADKYKFGEGIGGGSSGRPHELDEETAASLLVQFAHDRKRSYRRSAYPSTSRSEGNLMPQTPGSILGL